VSEICVRYDCSLELLHISGLVLECSLYTTSEHWRYLQSVVSLAPGQIEQIWIQISPVGVKKKFGMPRKTTFSLHNGSFNSKGHLKTKKFVSHFNKFHNFLDLKC